MNCAAASNASLEPFNEGPAVPPGASFAHALCAERNAGAVVSMSDGMFGSRLPGPGSGKFGTPCVRRHFTYVSAGSALEAAPVLLAEPQAASASAKPTTASHVMSHSGGAC